MHDIKERMKGEEIKIAAVNNLKCLQKESSRGQVVRILTFTATVQVQSWSGAEILASHVAWPKIKSLVRKRERSRVTVSE